MKRFEAVVSTTRLDAHGECMSREALGSLIDSISHSYIPIGIEHDPRIPPQGRIAAGLVRETPDGEYEAVAIIEMFNDDDDLSDSNDPREIVIRAHRENGLTISHDWTHRHESDQEDIAEIAAILGNRPLYEVKKAAEPISIITIGGAFVLGGIATGFLGQIGVDAWTFIKDKLARLFSRKEHRKGEQLLVFSALVEAEEQKVEVEIVLSDPSPEQIDQFLKTGLQTIDMILPIYLRNSPDIRRLTFEASGSKLELKFAVRKDCSPLVPTLKVEDIVKRIRKP